MPKEAGKRKDGKTVGRKRFCASGILPNELLDKVEVAGRGGFMQFKRGAARKEQLPDLVASGVDRQEHSRRTRLVFRSGERRIAIEQRSYSR